MHSRGARFGALASAAEAQLRRRPPGEIVLIVLQGIFVGATAALFVAWLMSAAGGGPSADAGCESLGRGGVRCAELAAGMAVPKGPPAARAPGGEGWSAPDEERAALA